MQAWLGSVGYKSSFIFSDDQQKAETQLRSDLGANVVDTNEYEDFKMKHVAFLDGDEAKTPTTIRAKLLAHDVLTEVIDEVNADEKHQALNKPVY
ncbi:hypothetical protein FHQ08_06170 [Lactobacillus sp. CC-MHH1034]|uniref:hypothetical protein n=1 Tax=Agrilactobacillus fermenti TaxID=2586909 RepID=UPI001E402992|nr:hypothetical protein [Agrilactobacillus fermenti]MCD2256303.1 hypothetical protein [Agrilactobacillus fermenti]